MTHEPQHTWTLEKDSLPISVYTKVWGFSASNVNFCKLFWAFVFLPIGLLILGAQNFFSGIGTGVKWVGDRLPEPAPKIKTRTNEWYEIRKLRDERRTLGQRIRRLKKIERARKRREFFEKLEAFFSPKADRVAEFVQNNDWIGSVFIFLMAAAAGFLITVVAIKYTTAFVIALAILIVAAAVIATLVILSDKGVLGKASQKFTHGLEDTIEFLGVGFKSVKDRTCPGVVVPGVADENEDAVEWSR